MLIGFFIISYLIIAFFTTLIKCSSYGEDHSILIGIWWPILLIKELFKSFMDAIR